jgi:hypothetical protein
MSYQRVLRLGLLVSSILLLEFGPYSNTSLRQLLRVLHEQQQLRQSLDRELVLLAKFLETQPAELERAKTKTLASNVLCYLATESTSLFNG